jgi:glutaredoxin 3|tara:strand:+ start:1118 stop:1360 length:243 start_codon:yes stop_codon:yes gene_type:complete
MKYVLFIKESCPFCIKAKEILELKKVEFKVVNFEEDQTNILQDIKEAYEWPTVPMIFQVKEGSTIKFVGGFSDLEKHLDE